MALITVDVMRHTLWVRGRAVECGRNETLELKVEAKLSLSCSPASFRTTRWRDAYPSSAVTGCMRPFGPFIRPWFDTE